VLRIQRAETAADVAKVQALWTEYWETLRLPLTFQGFGEQLEMLPGEFTLLLAFENAEPAGTVAVRPLHLGACEVKRLYVPTRFRGHALGRKLLQAAIVEARQAGYSEMFCDTLPSMQVAAALYESAGFTRVAAYSDNPTPGALYFRLGLQDGTA
jgi:putative acetyltransferase